MKYTTTKDIEQIYALAQENGFSLIPLFELGGWNMVMLLGKLGIPRTARITIVCSSERKGGFGLATAHHLLNHRWNVNVVLAQTDLSPQATYFLEIIKKIGAPVVSYQEEHSAAQRLIHSSQVVIDALLGTDAAKTRNATVNTLIALLSQSERKIISFDLPSGLDGSTGLSFPPVLRAYATLALAMPSQAFLSKEGPHLCGQVFMADIGLPKFIYDKISMGSRPKFDMHENAIMPFKDYLLD